MTSPWLLDPGGVWRAVLDVLARERMASLTLDQKIFEQIRSDRHLKERVTGLTTPSLIVWRHQDRAIQIGNVDVLTRCCRTPGASSWMTSASCR